MQQPEKAKIEARWQRGAREYRLQFNSTEITFDKKAQIAEIAIPGLDSPVLQFVRGQTETVIMELFFDTTDKGDMSDNAVSVTSETDRIYELVKIDPDRHAPPVCSFSWNSKFPGSDVTDNLGNQKRNDFQCIVESVKQTFTLFSPQGVPLRAKVTLTLREYKTLEEQFEQLRLNSPDRTHSHVVQRGETLAGIAARYYHTPGEWRRIAEANNIDDPRRLAAGVFLTVPPIGT
jgi:Contractile injection system tube protein/LysM domain